MSIVVGNWQGLQGGILAPRELEGVLHCANDCTVKEAAKAMGISPETLKKRLESARLKLKASSIRALVLEAFKRQIISPLVVTLCIILVGHSFAGADEYTRARRPGERKLVELRIHRRTESAWAMA